MKTPVAVLLLCLASFHPLLAQTWQEEFAKMPLAGNTNELNRHNCVKIMLASFKRNPTVKALIFMPGATDEFYFFHRAKAKITNASPTLLDAVMALTNQTYIHATFRPPFLLMHTLEDSLDPIIKIEDQHTADRIHKKHFEKHGVFNDRDWDYMQPILAFDLDTRMYPVLYSHESHHFFRHSFAEFGLNGWDALKAVALAGKTGFKVEKKQVTFFGDERVKPTAITPNPDFLYDKDGN